jgi:hypothetical protein
MKEFKYKYKNDESISPAGIEWSFLNWKDPPHKVLDLIDRLLEKHGLEIGIMESVGSFYEFSIIKRNR